LPVTVRQRSLLAELWSCILWHWWSC